MAIGVAHASQYVQIQNVSNVANDANGASGANGATVRLDPQNHQKAFCDGFASCSVPGNFDTTERRQNSHAK